ncbi:peptidase inhibitor family I36 protein [Streptomyces sp. NPDC018019]|uniref:peptidase inhibitor family I36 protein n=1 Tax=Streptomyces sp. NPDC018019 TaxID=3365030 RepID=UPI0037B95C4C
MRIRRITTLGVTAAALVLGPALPALANGPQPAPTVHHIRTATGDTADTAAGKARPRQKVEVWEHAKYKGKSKVFKNNQKNLKSSSWNDTISSAKNRGRRAVTFYSESHYHGAKFSLLSGQKEAHFGNRGMADTTSSIKFR